MKYLVAILALLIAAPATGQTTKESPPVIVPGGGGVVGGNCPAGEFVNTISPVGSITCTFPAYDNIVPPPTASGQILGSTSLNLPEWETVSGDVAFVWDSAGQYTANVVSVGGVPGPFAPINNPTFTGTVTTGPITAGAITASSVYTTSLTAVNIANFSSMQVSGVIMMQPGSQISFNGFAVGGTCAAGQFVNTISASLVPTCTVPANAPVVNPTGGQNNYAPIASPTFTSVVTAPTVVVTTLLSVPSGSTITGPDGGSWSNTGIQTNALRLPSGNNVLLFNGVPMGGACPANQFVISMTDNGNLACNVPNLAPLINPAGGQNNYAPLASPTFTGTTTAATLNVTGNTTIGGTLGVTGTMTFPDGSTYTTAGHNNMKSLGIGAPTNSTNLNNLLYIEKDVNATTSEVISNKTAGTSSQTVLYFNNDLSATTNSYGAVGLTSSLFTAGGGTVPGDSFGMLTGSSHGIVISSAVATAPIYFDVGGVNVGTFTQNGLVLPLTIPAGASSLMFGPTTSNTSLSAFTISGGNAAWSMGGYVNGTNWTAAATVAIMQNMTQTAFSNLGGIAWYINDGLTIGSTYTPTVVMQLGPVGNTNTTLSVTNPNTGTNASSSIYANSANYTAQMSIFGTGNTANPNIPANDALFAGNGADTIVGAMNNAATIGVKFWAGGTFLGKFRNDGAGFLGLELGGYASRIGTGTNGNSSLAFGNMYLTGSAFATGGISGSVLNTGGQWVSDGGTGGGGALLQLQGSCITMWNVGAVTGGTVVNWTEIGSWCGSGTSTDHLSNLTSARIPTVSSGALTQDSRDPFGWVTNIKGGQTTITFAESFITQSNCSLTASGAPYSWFNANQSPTQDTFVCVVPWTGEKCPDDVTVEYHCFGQAGKQVKAP